MLPPGAPPGTPSSYDSDSLTSYEVGYKMTSPDGRFGLDIAAYFLDWEDIQLFTVINGFGVNANGGTAESKGFEFATSFVPTERLTLYFNGAYTNAELTEDTHPLVGGMDGDPLPYVPEWSFGLSGDYQWPVSDSSTAYVGGTLGYTGDRPATFSETDPGGSVYELDSYTTLNLQAGLEMGRWAFEVYVKNLTDELGETSVGTADTMTSGWVNLGVLRPRTIGVSAGVRF